MEMTDYTKEALSASTTLMELHTYVKTVHYPITIFKINQFHNTIADGYPMYVSDVLIRWFGYDEPTSLERRAAFIRGLYRFIIGVDFYCLSNDTYSIFLHDIPTYRKSYYPSILLSKRAIYPDTTDMPSYHILLLPACLDKLMIDIKSSHAYGHYADIKELFRAYSIYKQAYLSCTYQANSTEHWDYIDLNSNVEDTDNSYTDIHTPNRHTRGDQVSKKAIDMLYRLPNNTSGHMIPDILIRQCTKASDA